MVRKSKEKPRLKEVDEIPHGFSLEYITENDDKITLILQSLPNKVTVHVNFYINDKKERPEKFICLSKKIKIRMLREFVSHRVSFKDNISDTDPFCIRANKLIEIFDILSTTQPQTEN